MNFLGNIAFRRCSVPADALVHCFLINFELLLHFFAQPAVELT